MIIKVLLLSALIKVLLATENPLLCSGIYAAIGMTMSLVQGYDFFPSLVGSLITFSLSLVYFYLLVKFLDSGLLWWAICLGGLLIGLV